MKTIHISRLAVVLAVTLVGALQVQAQDEYRTDISIAEQLKKGTVKGTKVKPEAFKSAKAVVLTNKNEGKESLGQQIKNGTLGGMPVAGGGGKKATFKTMAQPAKLAKVKDPLPSEQPMESKKTVTAPAGVTLPAQGEEKAPVKPTIIKAPVSVQGETPADKEAGKTNN
jgi:hypothetical protein